MNRSPLRSAFFVRMLLAVFVVLSVSCDRQSSRLYQMASDYHAVAKSISLELSLSDADDPDVSIDRIIQEQYALLGRPTPRYGALGTEFRFNPNPSAYDGVWSEQGSRGVIIAVARIDVRGHRAFVIRGDGSYAFSGWNSIYDGWIEVKEPAATEQE